MIFVQKEYKHIYVDIIYFNVLKNCYECGFLS